MNDTHLKSQLITTYTRLFVSLSELVEPSGFNKVIEAMRMEHPAFALATQYTWDALLHESRELLSAGATAIIEDGRRAVQFDYESYLRVAESDWEVKVGEFLWCWDETEQEFGGLIKIGRMFRDMGADEFEAMMRNISAKVAA